MQVVIDTPYMTISEFTRRSGQSTSAVENEIKAGKYIIRPKKEGSKGAVLLNMVHMTMEAAKQAERVLSVSVSSQR
ncbi:hypothetical protein KHO49_13620 [Pseudomonas sp. RC4D1]|uniref:hypothetical protein n=1 Tax=Pseudomonas sp. RC4D1 TaxID=2834407 RepID=UPI001BD15BEB|nr:hypothetical protein [Pseudomonas sp. RC4D1]MBS7559375.1 hypothetical protein [Pseudomonas sp. RC4D1]